MNKVTRQAVFEIIGDTDYDCAAAKDGADRLYLHHSGGIWVREAADLSQERRAERWAEWIADSKARGHKIYEGRFTIVVVDNAAL